jgi:valyl-tRNA synthetase
MDSSISPLYNTFWHRDEDIFKRLYPMSLRPQAHDIIRTWAFYTILRCNLLTNDKPFENMMMGGFILSEDGTPMHASLGNVIDPLEIIDEHGSDAFRCYAASCALGEDNSFRKKEVIRGTRLLRKIWNVEQFISNSLKIDSKPNQTELIEIDKWILTKYSKLINKCTELMDEYNYSQTMKEIEYFLWHELADHYIEMAKSSIYKGENLQSINYTLYTIGIGILKLFAPFFPYITEEIYQNNYKTHENIKSIHTSDWPKEIIIDAEKEKTGEIVKEYISQIRSYKSKQGMPLNSPINIINTYSEKVKINALKNNSQIIKTTLNLPEKHKFIEGKPDIKEEVTEIIPVYAKIGPLFKNESKKIIEWINKNQDELIRKINKNKDITWSDIKIIEEKDNEKLLENNYIKIKKERHIKGKKESDIIKIIDYYIELVDEV